MCLTEGNLKQPETAESHPEHFIGSHSGSPHAPGSGELLLFTLCTRLAREGHIGQKRSTPIISSVCSSGHLNR